MISSSEDDRLRLKIETEKGKVVDIVVQYEAKFDEEWHPIVRYDCSHGFLHRDVMLPYYRFPKLPQYEFLNLRDKLHCYYRKFNWAQRGWDVRGP